MKTVNAEIYTDDFVFHVNFDCTAWFEQASETELENLCRCEFRGDYPADEVGLFYSETNQEIKGLFSYLDRIQDTKTTGFEVRVHEEEALDWLQMHQPQVARKYINEEFDNEDSSD